MRDYQQEFEKRVAFIRELVRSSGTSGIVFGNSGGKDSALVGTLCKAACENTVGVILPCGTSQNYGQDTEDALRLAEYAGIESRTVDLTAVREAMVSAIEPACTVTDYAKGNISPRLRMTALYAIAGTENRLVAGTGNKSEIFMGYYTKWGDGASDFDPIADLTVREVFEFMDYLQIPESIRKKAPSAGLFEGQTDELEMGVSYASIEKYMCGEEVPDKDREIIERYHARSEHKRIGRNDYHE